MIGQPRKTPQKAAGDLEIAKNNFEISLENHQAPLHKAQQQPTNVKMHGKRFFFPLFFTGDHQNLCFFLFPPPITIDYIKLF